MTSKGWWAELESKMAERWKNPSWRNLLICLPWALGAAVMLYHYSVDHQLASREKTVTGVVTAHDPPNHDRYGYAFVVEGKSYNGWQIPYREQWAVGQSVLVYYDPLNPEKSALADFDELSARSLGPVPFLLVGIGTVATVIFLLRRDFRRLTGGTGSDRT